MHKSQQPQQIKLKVFMVPNLSSKSKIKVKTLMPTLFMYKAPPLQPVPMRKGKLCYKLQLLLQLTKMDQKQRKSKYYLTVEVNAPTLQIV